MIWITVESINLKAAKGGGDEQQFCIAWLDNTRCIDDGELLIWHKFVVTGAVWKYAEDSSAVLRGKSYNKYQEKIQVHNTIGHLPPPQTKQILFLILLPIIL